MSPIRAHDGPKSEQRGAGSERCRAPRCSLFALRFSLLALLLTAGTVTQPTIKLGLVAPFEGQDRAVGYEVIWAVRLAVREANEQALVPGYGLELVALDDMGDERRAQEQADKLAADPQVVAVLGHWLQATTAAVSEGYATAGLPLLAAGGVEPDLAAGRLPLWNADDCLLRSSQGCLEDWAGRQSDLTAGVCALAPLVLDEIDADFVEAYRSLAGAAPGPATVAAYDGTRALIAAIAQAAHDGPPTRTSVAAALPQVTVEGVGGIVSWQPDGRRSEITHRGYRLDPAGAWVADASACP